MLSKIKSIFLKAGLSNLISIVLLIVVLFYKGPQIFSNFILQTKKIESVNVERLSGELISFPVPDQKQIVIFWFTTCTPCKVEMQKLNRMISEGALRPENVIAINSYDSKEVVLEFLKTTSYQFLIALDSNGKLAEKFNVSSTPTILFFETDGSVSWATSGLSPTLEFRAKNFFSKGS